MKSSVYRNVGVTACCLGLLVTLMGWFGVSISLESTDPDTSSQLPTETTQWNTTSSTPVSPEKGISTNLSTLGATPTNQVEHSIRDTHPVLADRDKSASIANEQGTLRMSNQTNQPVRLALLARQSVAKGGTKINYDVPAHWDFAPQEGSDKGLILSLPQNNLKLEKGDILVAFAQDGSRRYWGPYVVGETQLPKWNSQNREWQLVLSP
ncbi:MAG: hypothetical protein V7K35_25760 [Nostoc sp.]|uniref:hypothetical protein n=1 Tax=Nostoc sp. TaxID=1180 RepID=UPI002FF83A19